MLWIHHTFLLAASQFTHYNQNRDSADIDLVCSADTAKKLIRTLYENADYNFEDINDDWYRPSWIITETGERERTIYLGFKITEREAYKYVDYDKIFEKRYRVPIQERNAEQHQGPHSRRSGLAEAPIVGK